MKRRETTAALIALAGSLEPPDLLAQNQASAPRVGLLILASLASVAGIIDGFRSSLRDLGYVDGRTIHLEVLSAEGNDERLPELAAQFVSRKVDIIVTGGGNVSTFAARKATATIPIVMSGSLNAVEAGLVQSLARPGGNVTGLTAPLELGLKQIQLLKELMPTLSRVVILVRHDQIAARDMDRATALIQMALGLSLHFVELRSPADIPRALAAVRAAKAEAIIVGTDPLLYQLREQIQAFSRAARIADMAPVADMVDEGSLVSFGLSAQESFRGVARFVDRILKGAKPAELPVEQPTVFELAINLRTARTLGLKIPQSVLLRADRVIE